MTAEPTISDKAYGEAYRDRQAKIMRAKRSSAREIMVGVCQNPERREACRLDFGKFCKTYFPALFSWPWSNDHLRIIDKTTAVVMRGGLFAEAVYRGFGKTCFCEAATLHAILYGHRLFVVFVGSAVESALASLDSIRTELETNDLLREDFPEVCDPIRALDGITHRCRGQTHNGERTRIGWYADKLVFPTIAGSACSGSVLLARGITAGLRGLKHTRNDGSAIRPDLLVIDDPQTDESARSASQCKERASIISGAILGLAGHDKSIAAIMPCTIIRRGDLADQYTTKTLHPEWQGERIAMVRAWAKEHETIWLKEYSQLRKDGQSKGEGTGKADEFYAANRVLMDEGADVSWQECYSREERSAIQHAYNLFIDRGELVFMAEYQNQPQDESASAEALTTDMVLARCNQHDEGLVPATCDRIVAFIDVNPGGKQRPINLYWCVVGSDCSYTSHVVSYGRYVGKRGGEDAIFESLDILADKILAREWRRDDGAAMRIARLHVDSGDETEHIYRWVRQSRHASDKIAASKGEGRHVDLGRRKPGRRIGDCWALGQTADGRPVRLVRYDANYWKTFTARRLSATVGSESSLCLFGKETRVHWNFADHLTSEYPIKVTERGDTFERWALRPARHNHYWDCVVGCMVALSVDGCGLRAVGVQEEPKQRKKWFAGMKKARNAS